MNLFEVHKIYHRSLMQTGKSETEGERIMPETRFTNFTAFSVDPRVGRDFSVYIGYRCLIIFLTYDVKDYKISFIISFIYDILRRKTAFYECDSVFFVVAHVTSLLKFRILTSLLKSCVSCLSPWAKQNFPAPPNIEQTLSHR